MNTKGRKNLKAPKKVFLTQREIRRLRLENQLWPNGHCNTFFPMECESGPGGSGVPSHRECHKKGRGFIGNKVGLSGYLFNATSKRKRKKILARK